MAIYIWLMDALFYSLEQLPLPFESSSIQDHNDCRWSSLLAVRSGDYNKVSRHKHSFNHLELFYRQHKKLEQLNLKFTESV